MHSPVVEPNMRLRSFHCVGLPIILFFFSTAAAPAQEADGAESIDRERAKLEQALKKMGIDFSEAMAKQRTEWDLKLRKLERESHESFSKQHAELAQKIRDLEQRRKSIQRK